MTAAQRMLLINPTIPGKRHARFPLAVLSLSAALQDRHNATILDGNIDRDFVSTVASCTTASGDSPRRASTACCPTTRSTTRGSI